MANENKESSLYGGYLKNIQRFYEKDPVVQASLQLILSIFTVAFFVFLAIRPTLTTITTLIKKIEDQKLADQKLNTKINQLVAAQDFLQSQGERVSLLVNKAIPAEPEIKRIAQEFELVANQNGVYVTSLIFQKTPLVGENASLIDKEEKIKGERFVLFTFSVAGEQGSLVNFLKAIEKTDRAITLTNLSFSRPQSATKISLPLVVSGKATAYYLPTDSAGRPTAEAGQAVTK